MRVARPSLHPLSAVRAGLASLALFLVIATATPAAASHYALEQVDFVTAAERFVLGRAGIFDTEVLLEWTATPSGRAWLVRVTGMEHQRLEALAGRCDLLRVTGIGPNILTVLVDAGIRDTRSLARARPAELLQRLRTAARGTPMATRLPAEDTLSAWIEEAIRLRPMLLKGMHELDVAP
jgi:hypothetical protein